MSESKRLLKNRQNNIAHPLLVVRPHFVAVMIGQLSFARMKHATFGSFQRLQWWDKNECNVQIKCFSRFSHTESRAKQYKPADCDLSWQQENLAYLKIKLIYLAKSVWKSLFRIIIYNPTRGRIFFIIQRGLSTERQNLLQNQFNNK